MNIFHRKNFALRLIFVHLIFALVLSTFDAFAVVQPSSAEIDSIKNPIERIEVSSGGNVEIIIDDDLLNSILQVPHGKKKQTIVKKTSTVKKKEQHGLQKVKGYRIQVFADARNQSSLESRARARGNAIAARFPKYRGQIYVNSSAPNWFTRVGNFLTASEAQSALSELKRSFPQFAGEMRVVNSAIYVLQ